MQASSHSNGILENPQTLKKKFSHEDIFKWVNLVVTFVLLFCVKGFLEFRAYCQLKGYYVFEVDSLIWLAAGFFFVFVLFSLFRPPNTLTTTS
jgi:hypothetical protein